MEKEYLYFVLTVAGFIITALIVKVCFYRNKLMCCKAYLIRCINENIKIKQRLPEAELPRFIGRDELTAEEFASIIKNMLKRLMFVGVFIMAFIIPAHAHDSNSDTKVILHFISDSDIFYSSYMQNRDSLDTLLNIIDDSAIAPASIQVDGYSHTKTLSKIRCNRVKSEMITRIGLKESDFKTRNFAGKYDGIANVVVVTVPVSKEKLPQIETSTDVQPQQPAPAVSENTAKEPECETPAVENKTNNTEVAQPETKASRHNLYLRANLLHWATLTPDLGIEWRIKEKWALLVNASYNSWSWNDKNRRYGLWEIAPELRRYIGTQNRGYLGLMYKAGSFNYKFNTIGKQGDIMGGGITGGYVLPLNRALSLDFSLGVGYLHADYDRYEVIEGVRVRQRNECKDWWGPISAGVTLTWKLF